MDIQLISVLCFHILTSGSDGALTMTPSNKAVLSETSRVVMSCASDRGFRAISWSYLQVGGSSVVPISIGSYVEDAQNQSYAVEQSGSQKINLIILSATMARAGTYICVDITPQQASAQLIIINSDPVCSMTPNAPTELLYNQVVQMSCSISYTANTSYVAVDMIWSKGSPATVVTSSMPQYATSGILTTAVSRITQTPGDFTPFPVFRCNTSFKVTGNPPGSATNPPDYSKSTQVNSPINVIYLKPAGASSITGAKDGDQLYLGTTVTCNVDANPSANYSWLDVTYGNKTNTSTIQIWHNGVYKCTAWNRAASTSASINVTTYTTTAAPTTVTTTILTTTVTTSRSTIPSGSGGGESVAPAEAPSSKGGLSERDKIIIGVVVGVGGTLVLVGILFAVLCRRCERTKITKTACVVDDERTDRTHSMGHEDYENSPRENSNIPHYEPLNVLSAQQLNAIPTYEPLPTVNEFGLTEYQSLQERDLSPSSEYETIKPSSLTEENISNRRF